LFSCTFAAVWFSSFHFSLLLAPLHVAHRKVNGAPLTSYFFFGSLFTVRAKRKERKEKKNNKSENFFRLKAVPFRRRLPKDVRRKNVSRGCAKRSSSSCGADEKKSVIVHQSV
jgi:hypothetical protein